MRIHRTNNERFDNNKHLVLQFSQFLFAVFTFTFVRFLGIFGELFHIRLYLKHSKQSFFIIVKLEMINTFSLYAEPSSCTDFRSTPFMPFLPSLPRRLRQHRRMQKKHTPSTTIEMPIKIATTPHGCTCSFSLAKSIFSWINVCFVTTASLGAAVPTAAAADAAPAAVGSAARMPNISVNSEAKKFTKLI